MKKIITILVCVTCISVTAIAQSGVRIGNLEFIVKKTENDTIAQITVDDPCPSFPSENETRPKPKFKRRTYNDGFCGIGFIMPDIGKDDYYTVLGGNSINIDIGGIRVYHFTRRFALGGTLNYSFYNYKFRDAVNDPESKFNQTVLGGKEFFNNDVQKQVYRTHNISAGLFTRFNLVPLRTTRDGTIVGGRSKLYIDLGAQGDFAASRFCMLKTQSEKKKRYHEDYAFNPFTASAIVRIGSSFLPGSHSAIFARYRFTDAFNSKALPMDLPPLTIGIQFF